MTLGSLDTVAKRGDGSENVGNLDRIDRVAMNNGHAAERAPSHRIARAE